MKKVYHLRVSTGIPGHMVRAQNDIKSDLKLIDIVIEVLDARVPISSQNPIISQMTNGKKKIVVLNKYDLADIEANNKWKKYFNSNDIECVLINALTGDNIKSLTDTIKKIGNEIYSNRDSNKSLNIKRIYRVLIVGIPNVGKSTIINKISNKKSANVGNKPGVTKKKQWIRIADNIDLLDTPGLLWPKFEDPMIGIKLALTGNIKQEIIDIEELACDGINILLNTEKYKKMLAEKYSLGDDDLLKEAYDILEKIGRKRGCLVSGGNVDMQKAAKIFLDEFKAGKIGRITLD